MTLDCSQEPQSVVCTELLTTLDEKNRSGFLQRPFCPSEYEEGKIKEPNGLSLLFTAKE